MFKSRFLWKAGFAVAVRLLVPLSATPQIQFPPPPPDPNDYKLTSNVAVVLLDVSVKGKDGGFVSGLKQENFQVKENGKAQKISGFLSQDVPVTIGLVVDNSGSMRPKRPEVVTAALAFVKESLPQDEMFVVNFNDTVEMGLPKTTQFTDDIKTLRQALLSNPVEGRTALYDAIEVALDHLKKGTCAKKALIVISDGGDNASRTKLEATVKRLESTSVTVYTIGIFTPDEKDQNPGVLKKIAAVTGGEAYIPEKVTDLEPVCSRIAKDIRNRYALSYTPDDKAYDNKMRKVEVVATGTGGQRYTVRTRTGYLAKPPREASSTASKQTSE